MPLLTRRIGDAYVTIDRHEDGTWDCHVTDAAYRPVSDALRRAALDAVLVELSSLRGHIYHEELGHPRQPKRPIKPDPKR